MQKQILWFRRDLRISDNKILHFAQGKVLPIFIFDKNILSKLDTDDKRISLIYTSVIKLKQELQYIGLDLAIFYDTPVNVFNGLKKHNFNRVLCAIDWQPYSIKRDKEVDKIIPLQRYNDAFLLHPEQTLSPSKKPYKTFTHFYNNLSAFYNQNSIKTYTVNNNLSKFKYDYNNFDFKQLGFAWQDISYIELDTDKLLNQLSKKIMHYQEQRDYFSYDATSNLSPHLRFGMISVREIFNAVRKLNNSDGFIRQLMWREFYNALLYFYPQNINKNCNNKDIKWQNNKEYFLAWQQGKTGVAIIDAAMIHLNNTGLMHNRLRMIVASFLSKNLLIDWKWGERYFAKTLLDYELSSNVFSWQYIAGTGFDSPPAFRVFNPIAQSIKYDKDALFIKTVLPHLQNNDVKTINSEIKAIVDLKTSRENAIKVFSEK